MRCLAAYILLWGAHDRVHGQQSPRNFKSNSNIQAELIRRAVMDREGFSKIIPPTSDRNQTLGLGTELGVVPTESGTDAFLQLRVFKVIDVKAHAGQMSLKVWMRMQVRVEYI